MKAKIIVKFFGDVEGLEKIQKGDWIDLRAAEDVELGFLESRKIKLNVAMQLPDGYEAILAPRSSTFDKWGLLQTNSIGVFDEAFCGNDDQWLFPVICLKPTGFKDGKNVSIIKKGDRICQFRIISHMPEIEVEVTNKLKGKNRGGFGSTGVD